MGILDDIGDTIESIVEAPGDLVEAAASFFDGPGGVAGIFVSGATFLVGGPQALVPAVIAGIGATEGANALIKTRKLSPEERMLAEFVFGDTLPPYDRIILTNFIGLGNRAFVMPNTAGEYLVNLGGDYDDPIRSSHDPEYGQLLIHELTHVWQIHHNSFVPGLICEGILNQSRYIILDKDVYNPGAGKKDWSTFNLEQQAKIVDLWYGGYLPVGKQKVTRFVGGPCSTSHPFYHYVVQVNGDVPPPAVGTLSVRAVAKRKFGAEGEFSIHARFPRYTSGVRSLRRSLIGLRGRLGP